ncbi:MAG: type IV pilus secretin PilQ [Desulfobacterales bacterium]|nr:type IV pilus secretin PilQ [Desulfobacterales bacterium]MDX2508172.1 type IV pilus secretin PilQ [Desulfobacterales bacterium]
MKKNNRFRTMTSSFIFSIFFAALIAGCATQEKEKSNLFFDEWKAKAQESKGFSPSARKFDRVLSPKKAKSASASGLLSEYKKPLPKKKITMKMNDIEVSVLLRALSRVANQNIMLNEKIRGKININITKAPWDQVFKSILRTHGLVYAWEGDIIRIMTNEDMENELKRESQKRDLRIIEPFITRIVHISYSEAAKLRENLEKFLTLNKDGKPLGSVLVDEHTNSLIIQAIGNDLSRILSIVEKLDRPTSQILIEAHIVETTNDTARELGIQWGGLGYGTSDGDNHWLGSSGTTSDGSLHDPITGDPITYLPPIGNMFNFPAALDGTTGMSLGYMFQNIGKGLLTVQLTALQQEGKLNILSSPSITTLENQLAIIESGARVPIQTVEDGEVNIKYEDAVLRLEVIPYVIDKNTVKLKILTNKDELDFTRTVAGNPTIITKKAETNVILSNGQTTVIGGLNKETASETESGVPLLKDIPGIGFLFRSRGKSNSMEEVLIFITPYILEERLGG